MSGRFRRGAQDRFYHWNDHLGVVEELTRMSHQLVPDMNRSGMYIEKAFNIAHPSLERDERVLKKENQIIPISKVHGTEANLGEFITLKLVPMTLYIHIKKGVQSVALQILAKRIVEHATEGETRILKQHNKKGKFSYRTWISSKLMRTQTAESFLQKLVDLTKNRKRPATIVVRQRMIKKGNIHNLWDTTFSLL